VMFEDFKLCPTCYSSKVTFSPSGYLAELEKSVITPIQLVQNLIDAHPEITRMYTTLSADEMTLDPLFGFNAELPSVSNQHTADRVIECKPSLSQFEAPWRIELPQGDVIRGVGTQGLSTWPAALTTQPPNRQVVQAGETGKGKVLDDQSKAITDALGTYNAQVMSGTPTAGGGGTGGMGSGGTGAVSSAGAGATPSAGAGATPSAGAGAEAGSSPTSAVSGGSCSVSGGKNPLSAFALAAALGAVVLRRRRRG